MPGILEEQAFGPMKPAVQMAVDASEHLTEASRISVAALIVKDVDSPASIAGLTRLKAVIDATIREIQASRMADDMPVDSSVDPVFMRVFLGYYIDPKGTSFAAAYRAAVLHVSTHRIVCIAPPQYVVRHALKAYHTGAGGHA